MPTEVSGTISTFGNQVLSNKPSEPSAKIGTAGRVTALAEQQWETMKFGQGSPNVGADLPSAFGEQPLTNKRNAPKPTFGNRYASDQQMNKMAMPGPGTYHAPESFGKQTSSRNASEPNAKIGTGQRFGQYKTTFKNDFDVPAASSWTPSSGWIGDAPTFTFHGKGKRADIAKGLPGFKPTPGDTPGPGSYEAQPAFGPQPMSKRESVPRARIGTANREHAARVYVTKEHERERYGMHSPSPHQYSPSLKGTSKVRTTSSWGFGSGDRFSEVKSQNARTLKVMTPGPGTYVV